MTDKMDRNWKCIKVDRRMIVEGANLATSYSSVIIGIAAVDMEPGSLLNIDMRKGPNQLIWPSDGKEIIIEAESVEDAPKLLTGEVKKEKENGKRH